MNEALKSPDLRADGWSANELVSGLSRLAMNNDNSAVIMKHGILNNIRVMLTKGMARRPPALGRTSFRLFFFFFFFFFLRKIFFEVDRLKFCRFAGKPDDSSIMTSRVYCA